MIKAVFFDFDMTLIDSAPLAHESYRALLNYYHQKPTQKGFSVYIGTRVSAYLNTLSKETKEKKRLIKIFLEVHENKIKKLKVYGKAALTYLKNKKIKIVIISNNSREVIKKTCKVHNLHYNLIIADEDMKFGEKKHQAMTSALKKLGLKKNEIFYVGDHINDIKEGKKAGVKVVSVTTGVFSKKQLSKYHPDYIINDLNKLIEML